MESSFKDIPRLGETKTKPQHGEIRLTKDGTRRKIFDGNCWQYLCNGDPKCRIQSKSFCRFHKTPSPSVVKSKKPLMHFKSTKPFIGEMQTLPSGHRRVWKGTRWHGLCREEGCAVQARDFCKTHLDQRNSLPNTKVNVISGKRASLRSRSLTINSVFDKKEEQEETSASSLVNSTLSPELLPNTSLDTSINKSSPKRRTRSRRRSMNSIWKDMSLENRDPPMTRRSHRLNQSLEKLDTQSNDDLPVISTDTIENCSQIEQENSKKRKTTADPNNEEHIVPKRKPYGRRRKHSNKSLTLSLEPTSSNTSISDIPRKDKSMDESALSDSDVSLRLKPNRLHTNYQSVEIPVQAPSPFSLDSSTSAILEQFGTIIKKEAVIEEESLICVAPVSTEPIESPCETLQDFLRAEEIKNKEFKLDCQRISYRLAKIQDCIGSLSSITT